MRSRATFLTTVGCLSVLTLLPGQLLAATTSRYDDVIARVRSLSNAPNVRLLRFGRSTQGRAIPALVISDFSVNSANKARLLVCAGQHGDEYNPVNSLLSLCGKLASGSDPELLASSVIIVVPVINPDGLSAGGRHNAEGLDINRDWSTLKTPEARFVHGMIKSWRPHVLIDLHEWLSSPALFCGNEIEVAPSALETQSRAMRALGGTVENASNLTMIACQPNSHTGLFHRAYAALGYAAFLVETDCGVSHAAKDRMYKAAILTAAAQVSRNPDMRLTLSPASKTFGISTVSAYLEPLPRSAPDAAQPVTMACVFVGAYCLLMWAVRPFRRTEETVWDRRFRKCAIDAEVADDPVRLRRALPPITSRSWMKRRVRSRFVTTSQREPTTAGQG